MLLLQSTKVTCQVRLAIMLTPRLLIGSTEAPAEHAHDDKIVGMSMVGAVDILEALFDKAQADLNYATHRIDHEFNEQYSKAGSPQV